MNAMDVFAFVDGLPREAVGPRFQVVVEHDHAVGMKMLLRRAAAAFRRTKPSGRMEARSFGRTVPDMRFHMRIRRRCMCLATERERLGRGLLLQKTE